MFSVEPAAEPQMANGARVYPPVDVDLLEQSLQDLTRAGELDSALALISSAWPSVCCSHGARLRAMIESLPEEVWGADPWILTAMGASYRSLGSTSRSAALPWFGAAEAQRSGGKAGPRDAIMLLHHAAALRSLGLLSSALEKSEAARTLLENDVSTTATLRIRGQAQAALQIGLLKLHLGDVDGAFPLLRLALGLSEKYLVQSERVECLSGLSLLAYFSGDLPAADAFTAQARVESGTTSLLTSRFGAGALIAETLLAVERADRTHVLELVGSMSRAAERSDWEPLAHLARASASGVHRDFIEALDHLRHGLDSAHGWEGEPDVRIMCHMLYGTLLMHLGEFAAALATFALIEPSPDHRICPARFVAGIRYKAGDNAGCLEALQGCGELGETHSALTTVDVMLFRAAANYELDTPYAADVAFDRALQLAAHNMMRTPFLLVSSTTLHRMLNRARERNQPVSVLELMEQLHSTRTGSTTGSLEPLSDRERDIAEQLSQDKTISQIAADLFISTNTVKTHVRSIYRKLSANSRKDAVRRGIELGLDLKITPS